jgi:hypothetical protein
MSGFIIGVDQVVKKCHGYAEETGRAQCDHCRRAVCSEEKSAAADGSKKG